MFRISILALAFIIVFSSVVISEDITTTKIKTKTVQCGMCKKTIEKALDDIEGIISVDVNYKKKYAKVKFDTEIISLDEIREYISKAGYDADDVKADPEVYKKLHSCCKLPEDR